MDKPLAYKFRVRNAAWILATLTFVVGFCLVLGYWME